MARGAGTVLRRKLGAIQTRGYSFPVQSALARRLELAAAKGATAALGVTTEAITEHSRVARLADLMEALPETGLFGLLETEGGGAGAAIGFETGLVDHVVEILAGGEPGRPRATSARTPTAIDAALCRRLAEAILAALDADIRRLADGAGLGPMRWCRAEHLSVKLQHALPDRQYLIIRVGLDIADGARTGSLHLALPLVAIEPVETVLRRHGLIRSQDESEDWSRHMRRVVRRTRIRLCAVLDRTRMHVGELSRLEVGSILPLTGVTLDDVVLELRAGDEAHRIARGRLGSHRRHKAVRLIEPPEPGLLAPLAEALDAGPDLPAPAPSPEPTSGEGRQPPPPAPARP